MQQTKKFKMADAISPYLAVSCGLMSLFCVAGWWQIICLIYVVDYLIENS